MALYKVPQDVEAEDKLLGPFSFRQFIFLIITVAMLAMCYGLGVVMLPLAIIPLPIAIFFGTLALPLKKDQPMEVYLAAIISFILKPKKRLWRPDGIEYLVEVIAPKVEEKTYGNNYNQEEVQRRLSYLANLVDSHGWSIRGVSDPNAVNSSVRQEVYNEAQLANDFLDENGTTAQNINNLISQSENRRRQQMIQNMTNQMAVPPPVSAPNPGPVPVSAPVPTSVMDQTPVSAPTPDLTPGPSPVMMSTPDTNSVPAPDPVPNPAPIVSEEPAAPLQINPYPTMHQSTIMPLSQTEQSNTSVTAVSPAIIDLANNHQDLSIETLQREANRIEREREMQEEVVISLH